MPGKSISYILASDAAKWLNVSVTHLQRLAKQHNILSHASCMKIRPNYTQSKFGNYSRFQASYLYKFNDIKELHRLRNAKRD